MPQFFSSIGCFKTSTRHSYAAVDRVLRREYCESTIHPRRGGSNGRQFLRSAIIRAARLALLPEDNALVADGYHRMCASFCTDENTDIPLKLAGATR